MDSVPVDLLEEAPVSTIPADRLVCSLAPCVGCANSVTAVISDRFEGRLATCDPRGYDGLTDDGDHVCSDCWCPTCRNFHTNARAFEQCEIDGGQPALCDSGEWVAAGTIR